MDNQETTENVQGKVKSFVTDHGSVYTYDKDGKTTRFKTATQENFPLQDLTVFVKLSPAEEQTVLEAYRLNDENKSIVVMEKQANSDIPKKMSDRRDISDPDSIFLAVLDHDKYTLIKKASLTPIVGFVVFDMRSFQENDEQFTERHLGNKVISIEY